MTNNMMLLIATDTRREFTSSETQLESLRKKRNNVSRQIDGLTLSDDSRRRAIGCREISQSGNQ